jgi:uncharacterized cupredoxin-like copper-binding protein
MRVEVGGGRRPLAGLAAAAAAVVLVLALAGCSKGQAVAAAGPPVYKVSVQNFKYAGFPATVKSGESIIVFSNRESGPITHEMILLALPAGKSGNDIAADTKAKGADAEGDYLSFGEIGEVDTGSSKANLFSLPPGNYALACFEDGKIGGGKGPVHATIGMVNQFTVS